MAAPTPKPDKTSVQILEQFLEEAKAGKLVGLVVACEYRIIPDATYSISCTMSNDGDLNHQLAAATMLFNRVGDVHANAAESV